MSAVHVFSPQTTQIKMSVSYVKICIRAVDFNCCLPLLPEVYELTTGHDDTTDVGQSQQPIEILFFFIKCSLKIHGGAEMR